MFDRIKALGVAGQIGTASKLSRVFGRQCMGSPTGPGMS